MSAIPSELEGVITSDQDHLSGGVRFVGTRVFVQSLLDYVNGGESLDEFLLDFPDVTREQALTVLAWQNQHTREGLGLDRAS